MAMELKITSPKEGSPIPAIEFNYEELKGQLGESLKKYEGLVYTDETVPDAKRDRAKLNKLKTAMDTKRKEIKKMCLAPYIGFETQVKELIGMVDAPMQAIDTQVKGYEERKREEKQAAIQEIWDAAESPVKKLVPLEAVFDPRWLNAGYAIKKIDQEISAFLEKVETELKTIEELKTEFEEQVVNAYLCTFNIATALAENKKLLEQKAKREEYRRQQEEAAAARAREQEAQAATPAPESEPAPYPAPAKVQNIAVTKVPKEPEESVVDFRVWATEVQLTALREFMHANSIRYGRVPEQDAA